MSRPAPPPVIAAGRSGCGVRVAHLLWGLLGLSTSVLCLTIGGHPPLLIYLPAAVAAWALGHLALWAVTRLASRGRRDAAAAVTEAMGWPPAVAAALALAGLVLPFGAAQILLVGYAAESHTFWDRVLLALGTALWMAHAACFVGLLLRRRWSRKVAAALALGWALGLAGLLAVYVLRPRPIDPIEMSIVAGLVLLLSAIAHRLMVSERVRRFIAVGKAPNRGS